MPSHLPTFAPLEPTAIGSAAMTARVFQLYQLFVSILESEEFKILQAGVRHIATRNTPPGSDANQGEDVTEERYYGDYDGNYDDHDDEEENETAKPAVYQVVCDSSKQLEDIQELDKPKFDLLMRQTDVALGKKYREALSLLKEFIPDNGKDRYTVLSFPERLIKWVNETISMEAKVSVAGLIMLQLDTSGSLFEDISCQAVSWAIGKLYKHEKYTFKQALSPLKMSYARDEVLDALKSELEKFGRLEELPEMHDDLWTGDLKMAATDVLALYFWDDEDRRNKLGIAKEWAVHPCRKIHSRLRHTLSKCICPGDDNADRETIMDMAVNGVFMNEVKAAVIKAVDDNIVELAYNCWTNMLFDLVWVVEREISAARETVLSEVADRAVNRSRPRVARTNWDVQSEMSEP